MAVSHRLAIATASAAVVLSVAAGAYLWGRGQGSANKGPREPQERADERALLQTPV
jgi:hypothetical protein